MLKEILAGYAAEKKVHLRHLIQVGISMEEKGKAFYDSLAEKAVKQGVKDLCSGLAQAELGHKQFLEDMVSRWLPLPINNERSAFIERELKARGIFLAPPSPDSTEKEFLKYAIGMENKMMDFYLFFEEKFQETWKKMNVDKVANEERRHAEQLTAWLDK